jgi:diacylglycerol kinase (ATP)
VLIATLLAVLIVELLNTGIEAIVDLVSPDHHRLAGVAKDAGAAAVLLALLLTSTVWLIVFWPRG